MGDGEGVGAGVFELAGELGELAGDLGGEGGAGLARPEPLVAPEDGFEKVALLGIEEVVEGDLVGGGDGVRPIGRDDGALDVAGNEEGRV